jgi:hypothetical protein
MKIKVHIDMDGRIFSAENANINRSEIIDFMEDITEELMMKALDIELSERKNTMPPVPPLELYEEETLHNQL